MPRGVTKIGNRQKWKDKSEEKEEDDWRYAGLRRKSTTTTE
jgi:hypothetical protein